MTTKPLVSIAINNYNYGRFLPEAIDSALDQTYPHTEVIVVDDGSTDNSKEVIEGYEERIVSVLKENGGQASAFNAGFASSKGEIVIFLDADDMLLPEAVERVVEAFEVQPGLAKVQYRLRLVDAEGRPRSAVVPPYGLQMPNGDIRHHVMRFYEHPRPPTSGNAFSSAVLRRFLPLPEEKLETYRIDADVYLNDLSVIFGPVASLQSVGGLYRMHGKNLYASALSIDPVRLRQSLLRRGHNRTRQKQLLDELYSLKVREVGRWALFFLRDRIIYRRLNPADYPFDEGLVFLSTQGCIASLLYPRMSLPKRIFYMLWFLAMLIAPRGLAKSMAQQTLYPGSAREGNIDGLLAAFRRNLLKRGKHERRIAQ